ncbi:hypothetical protein [Blastopirellula marina]|nr:hypothetical protein [Blastopirellula marina]
MARIFLTIVGTVYLLLAAWCSFSPEHTSKVVGFTLQPGSGQSEFLTVYGGLEFALGLAFLWPLYRPTDVESPLLLCLLIHGCLVAFRTAGFLVFSDIPADTYSLATAEWIIFLFAAILVRRKS